MLSYYGSKWRLAPKYPLPRFTTIVEPFAGGAGYSLHYPHLDVRLYELNPIVASVWRYLIHVPAKEILQLPLLAPGEHVDDAKICQEAKWLIGFWLGAATTSPRQTLSRWASGAPDNNVKFWGKRCRERIASQVDNIRHWKIYHKSYLDAPIRPATWFVDPPYGEMCIHYPYGSTKLDFSALGKWCLSLPGQVMVCENEGALWLPFRPLCNAHGSMVKPGRVFRKEVIWTSDREVKQVA